MYGHLAICSELKNMMSSKNVHTCHHTHKFLCKSLELKIQLNTGQTPGTTAERNAYKSTGGFLAIYAISGIEGKNDVVNAGEREKERKRSGGGGGDIL